METFTSAKALMETVSKFQGLAVLFFYADFHLPSKSGGQLDQVFVHLKTLHSSARKDVMFAKVDAENEDMEDLVQEFGISMVPTFVFIMNGKKIETIQGVNPPELVTHLERNLNLLETSKLSEMKQAMITKTNGATTTTTTTTTENDEVLVLTEELKQRFERLIHTAPVMIFIKGTPSTVRCKFSKKLVGILDGEKIQYASFDILSDDTVREGLKMYSNWKTYPQVYVDGKLIGGTDIVEEMVADGSMKEVIDKAIKARSDASEAPIQSSSTTTTKTQSINERLKQLIATDKIMLFMKGTPEQPQCGYSGKIVKILQSTNVKFSSFNILSDNSVREGLKIYSNFPTFPQLYVNNELIGGLDIVQELQAEGELEEILKNKTN